MMPKYDFKCIKCGVFVTSSHSAGFAPDSCEIYCPGCNRETHHERNYSFGIPRGASGEGLRRVGLQPYSEAEGAGVPEVLQEEPQEGTQGTESV